MDSKEDIQKEYFMWLCSLVHTEEHYFLLKSLHNKVCFSVNPMDRNRESSGKRLRSEFCEGDSVKEVYALTGPCSVLEMLIGLAKDMDYTLWNPKFGDREAEWFWEMITNLELDDLCDEFYYERDGDERCFESIGRLLERRYEPDGSGGLFPLRNPAEDQRRVELWYQCQAYIVENFDENGVRIE